MAHVALVVGGTGLVGSHLVRRLLEEPRYEKVKVFLRRPTGLRSSKLEEHTVDFGDLSAWAHLLDGDHLFSALGTTLRQAGSKEAQFQVDYTAQHGVAAHARERGVEDMALVSSAGANPASRLFYSRIKGQLEEALKELGFRHLLILRPSLLLGEREVPRPGERFAEVALKATAWIPGVARYRGVRAVTVARAMVEGLNREGAAGVTLLEPDEVRAAGGEL